MRWCSIFECIHQEAKLSLSTLWCEAENLEHLLLQLGVVDTERTSTHFNTITYEVVSLGAYLLWMLIQERNIIRIWHGERMVSSHQALLFIAPLKQWEVNNPETFEHVLVAQAQAVTHFQTERAELNTSLVGVVAAEPKRSVDVAPMTAYEIISIFIGILALLMSFGSLIVALLAFLDKIKRKDLRGRSGENKNAYPRV